MKRLLNRSFILLALLGVLFTSCKKDNYDMPPIQDLPIGRVYTIEQILALESGSVFNEDASVYGIITADEVSGNLYKAAFIQERATGKAIELYMKATSGVRIGDSIRVYLKGVTYALYNGLPQLSNFEPDGHIVILANDRPIQPALASISDIKSGKYLAGLVRLEKVWFTEQATFANLNDYGNRCLVDSLNPVGNKDFVVRTSNYANFANDPLPSDTGNLVAIASKFGNTCQLLIRSANELEFEVYNPVPPVTPVTPGEVQSLPYTQSFESEFGSYMTYSVLGTQSWAIDYKTAKMTGYENSVNYANEDWLYSSPVAITDVNHAKVAVNYVAQYQTNLENDVTLQVSTDYVYGSDPTTATWKQMSASYPNTSNWDDFKTVETSLDEFVGQTVTVAIKYISDDSQSRTFEVKYITVEEGEAGGDTPPDPGQGEGNGTADDPYNVAAGIGLQGNNVVAWVKGYIVGAVKSGDGHNTVTSNDDIDWSAPFGRATNVLIADDASCNEVANCLIVKMPSGSALRSQVNLIEHPDNLGLQLIVNGTLKNAFGQQSGLDSPGTASDFVFEGGGTPTPPEPGTGIFSETFANGQGQFVIQNVTLPSELTYVWTHDASRKHMKASAFKSNTAYRAESWLVSPKIDLSNVNSAELSFEQAINYANPEDRIHVMISDDYVGDVANASWTELEFDQWPANDGNWTFVTTTIDLTAFVNQEVTIAFKYTSEAVQNACPTWEIKNLVVE